MNYIQRFTIVLTILLTVPNAALGVPKARVLAFGTWTKVQFFLGPNEDHFVEIKVRALLVDGKVKEFTTGDVHEVTERFFVVRKAYRLNDWLPDDDKPKEHHWRWQRGAWLLVDRTTMHITQLNLPEFDAFYSGASWFRDYVAYCGVSDDATKVYAVVAQIGRRKPVLKQKLGEAKNADTPESECAQPHWERNPIRVTFMPEGGQKQTYTVFGHAADAMPIDNEDVE